MFLRTPWRAPPPKAILDKAVRARLGAVSGLRRLRGGAVQEHWAFNAGGQRYVARMSPQMPLASSLSKLQEFQLIQHLHGLGILTPTPVLCAPPLLAVYAFIPGESCGHRLATSRRYRSLRPTLVQQLARELARIHAVPTTLPVLSPPESRDSPAQAALQQIKAQMHRLHMASPVLDEALRWLQERLPPTETLSLTHGDFRTGNFRVSHQGLAAVLDWEFATLGDPNSDLGWFMAPCWRPWQLQLEAGGLGSRAAFLRCYEQEAGRAVDPQALHWWQLFAHLRWAVIAAEQYQRFVRGTPSLDLCLCGRRVQEQEEFLLRSMPLSATLSTGKPEPSASTIVCALLRTYWGDWTTLGRAGKLLLAPS